jgi:hypothetical protein
LRGQAWLWRRWIWQKAGVYITQTADELDGGIKPLRSGWRVEGQGRRIDWVGGLGEVRTVIDGRTVDSLVDPKT